MSAWERSLSTLSFHRSSLSSLMRLPPRPPRRCSPSPAKWPESPARPIQPNKPNPPNPPGPHQPNQPSQPRNRATADPEPKPKEPSPKLISGHTQTPKSVCSSPDPQKPMFPPRSVPLPFCARSRCRSRRFHAFTVPKGSKVSQFEKGTHPTHPTHPW